jgi:hypothetical protein
MSSGSVTTDPVMMAAVNLHGDQAFQSLYSGIGLTGLLASAAIVFVYHWAKSPKWGFGTGVVIVFFTNFLVTGLIVPLVLSYGNNNGTISLNGTDKFRGLLSLAGIGQAETFGSFIVCLILVVLLGKRFKWGKGASIVMIIVLPLFYLHWLLPFWASTGINLGGMSIPGIG